MAFNNVPSILNFNETSGEPPTWKFKDFHVEAVALPWVIRPGQTERKFSVDTVVLHWYYNPGQTVKNVND